MSGRVFVPDLEKCFTHCLATCLPCDFMCCWGTAACLFFHLSVLTLQVVYFGDSMRSDVFPAGSFGKWETVMIVEEMEGEGVPKSDAAMSNEAQAEPLEKKGKFEVSSLEQLPYAVSTLVFSPFQPPSSSSSSSFKSPLLREQFLQSILSNIPQLCNTGMCKHVRTRCY